MSDAPKTGKDLIEEEKEAIVGREKLRKQFPKVEFPNPILEPVYYGRLNKTVVANKKLIRDGNSDSQFAIVSDKYKVVYHEDILADLLSAIPEEFGNPEYTISMLSDGARMVVTAKFPEITGEINDSPINMRIRLQNSYDTSVLVGYSWGADELVCTNGLVAYREKDGAKARHMNGSVSKLQLTNNINASFSNFSEQIGLWQSWAKKQISKTQLTEVLEALPFSETETEKLLDLPLMNHKNKTLASMNKPSIWAINSAATQYAQHGVTSEKRSIDLEEKIAKTVTKFANTA